MPFIKNSFAFQLRESSRDLSIVKGPISIDMGLFTVGKARGFDALKCKVIFDKWNYFRLLSKRTNRTNKRSASSEARLHSSSLRKPSLRRGGFQSISLKTFPGLEAPGLAIRQLPALHQYYARFLSLASS